MSIFRPADILLPRVSEWERWSVIACDQFTSEPDYWDEAERIAGDAPSALRLILPEAWLGTERAGNAAGRIAEAMHEYYDNGIMYTIPSSFVYIERTQPDGRIRRGLLGALDLESYDFAPGNTAPVRATEDTVADRLPPRIAVRRGALLELPHIMLLADDRTESVLGTLAGEKAELPLLYDFELMLGGGRIRGYQVSGERAEKAEAAVAALGAPAAQREKYGWDGEPMVIAVGDGNHSLAAAKRWWEELRETLTPAERETHPARFALCELMNIQDAAIDFEPIHRVLLQTDAADFLREAASLCGTMPGSDFTVRFIAEGQERSLKAGGLTVGELIGRCESFAREYLSSHGGRIDYIHGDESCRSLASGQGCCGILLPPMNKGDLFSSVLRSGAFPRKSFSIGHSRDKRYYLEARKIR